MVMSEVNNLNDSWSVHLSAGFTGEMANPNGVLRSDWLYVCLVRYLPTGCLEQFKNIAVEPVVHAVT